MKAIYEPTGKAKEYCDLAVNLYKGCNHGCSYCYAPDIWRKMGLSREDFYNHPAVRPGILDALAKEAPKYKGREVQLCFTCDPYQLIDAELQITREAIKILKANSITIRILTKGSLRSKRDFDLLEPGCDWYGVTLTFTNPIQSMQWEPNGDLPGERMAALRHAHMLGINTWASLEPVIDPEQSLEIIRLTHDCVDVFKVGKWNHDIRAKEIDWADFVNMAVALLEYFGKEYYIKEDLRQYLD
jgi:DNA repair photolyase